MACADVDMDIHGADEEPRRADQMEPPRIRYYQASVLMPDDKGPLHDLLQKQPAVLGSLQVVSGLLSLGVGMIFAVTQEMEQSLFTLFRISHMTGALFIIAGVISNLLFKYPELLPVSFMVNCGCIAVALVAACLTSVDLVQWSHGNDQFLKSSLSAMFGFSILPLHHAIELLELCVLGLEVFLSAILCFWFSKEKRAMSL